MVWRDSKCQISAEMIIILAAIVAIAAIVVTKLLKNTKEYTNAYDEKSKKLLDEIKNA